MGVLGLGLFFLEESLKAVWCEYKYEEKKYCAILLTRSHL